ncbi:MAG: hypothetical protein NUV77_04390 [Thermoguttaceae bacterium]|nr:hypothetical protein [Thermoguttaceae bacterium]
MAGIRFSLEVARVAADALVSFLGTLIDREISPDVLVAEIERVGLPPVVGQAAIDAAANLNYLSRTESAAALLTRRGPLPVGVDAVRVARELSEWSVEGLAAETLAVLDGRRAPTEGQCEEAKQAESAMARLLSILTGGVADERLKQAAEVLDSDLAVNDKLTRIDALIGWPAAASASDLAAVIGCDKSRVLRSSWWLERRAGRHDDGATERERRLRERAHRLERRTDHD